MIERLKKQSLTKLLIMAWNVLRFAFYKVFRKTNIKAPVIQNLHPSTEIAVRGGILQLSHSVFSRRNVSFRVENGEMQIGTSFFNQGCCVTALNKIIIGDDCLFGPNVVIVDHDHDYHYVGNERGNHYALGEVIIGNNVWVGANCVIMRGTHIEDGAVIGAGTVVKGYVGKNTVVYSERNLNSRPIRCTD